MSMRHYHILIHSMTLGLLVLNFTVFHHSRLSQSQSWGGLKLWLWHQFHWSLRKSVWDHSRRFIRETNWHTMRVLALTSSLGLLFFFVVLYQVWQSNRRLHYPALLVSHFLFVVSQGHDSWHFLPGQFSSELMVTSVSWFRLLAWQEIVFGKVFLWSLH